MKSFAEIMTGLYLVSEALSLIPAIKANGTFELALQIIVWLKGAVMK